MTVWETIRVDTSSILLTEETLEYQVSNHFFSLIIHLFLVDYRSRLEVSEEQEIKVAALNSLQPLEVPVLSTWDKSSWEFTKSQHRT